MKSLTATFFPRAQLRSIVEGVLAPRPLDYSLVGAKFMGKSHILNHLISADGPIFGPDERNWRPERYRDGAGIVAVYYDCGWAQAEEDFLGFLAARLERQLRAEGYPADATGENLPSAQRLRQVVRWALAQELRLVLLLDNFDALLVGPSALQEQQVNQLRPLALDIAFVVATERPLHELNRELASSPLFNLLNQVFLRLIEPEVAKALLAEVVEAVGGEEALVQTLFDWTGGHPFLLSRIEEILRDVDEILPAGQTLGPVHLPLIEMRLTEEYGRLLFDSFWAELSPETDARAATARELLKRLLTAPISLDKLQPAESRAINWLINRAMVRIQSNSYQLLSPLLAEYLAGKFSLSARKLSLMPIADSMQTFLEEQADQFTQQEKSLLRYFLEHPDEIVSVERLLADVWKRPNASARRVQEGIRRLRNRLQSLDTPIGTIENEWGQGYRFVLANGNGAVAS